jgi:hypothetical protein
MNADNVLYGKNKILIDDDKLPFSFNNKITIRGSLELFDIFFSLHNLQSSFNINCNNLNIKMLKTASGIEKYLDYPELRKAIYSAEQKELALEYLEVIDNILFNDGKSHTFYNPIEINSYNDTESLTSYDSEIDSIRDAYNMQIKVLEHKIVELEYKLQLRDKDIQILNLKFADREKEIKIEKLESKCKDEWI